MSAEASPQQTAVVTDVPEVDAAAAKAIRRKAEQENFPVASRLLASRLRAPVACFYAFARAADDIADAPGLTPEEKLARLDTFAAALQDTEAVTAPDAAPAAVLGRCLRARRLSDRNALKLLEAFRRDARKSRYADWVELMDYCRHSAAPVGRQVLDFAGESPAVYVYADPLCNALQVLNHLQDMGSDYRKLGRIYLPQDWMKAAGAEEPMLARRHLSPELRRVVNRCLDQCAVLLDASRHLPKEVANRRLAAECAAIHALAEALLTRLRRRDPLARRVKLGRLARLGVGLRGALSGYRRHRRHGPLLLHLQAEEEEPTA